VLGLGILGFLGVGLPILMVLYGQWKFDNGDWRPERFTKNPEPTMDMLEEELGPHAQVTALHISAISNSSIRVAEGDDVIEYRFTDEIHQRNRLSSHDDPTPCDMELGEVPVHLLDELVDTARERTDLERPTLDAIDLQCRDGKYAWSVRHVMKKNEDGVSGDSRSVFPLKRKR
jgi:hypothetical protein